MFNPYSAHPCDITDEIEEEANGKIQLNCLCIGVDNTTPHPLPAAALPFSWGSSPGPGALAAGPRSRGPRAGRQALRVGDKPLLWAGKMLRESLNAAALLAVQGASEPQQQRAPDAPRSGGLPAAGPASA